MVFEQAGRQADRQIVLKFLCIFELLYFHFFIKGTVAIIGNNAL